MKQNKLDKETQKKIIESIAKKVEEKILEKIYKALPYKDEERWNKFLEGWKKGEGVLLTTIESQVWFLMKMGKWKEGMEEKLSKQFARKIMKSKQFKKAMEKPEKVIKKEKRKLWLIKKAWGEKDEKGR